MTSTLRRGYWCACSTESLRWPRGGPALLAAIDAYSAWQADRWVAVALRTISPALDAAASDEAWTWLHAGRLETRRSLLRREPCTVTITHAYTRIMWTIRPVLFPPLASRQDAEVRSCADAFRLRCAE
ncbi:hypothetical protein [Streptomyces sp. WP-1]|uniref:hypothetical protein n=1 Tax=Streptomyces sp. WP-1 TaxID=3041497 RepID=UPI0026496949|nr:hypothetical protein [Streptomyces sp. WP-1]WKE70989.1 hypothetical protein QHG49_19145 [Streptomyces sp. WP-1]